MWSNSLTRKGEENGLRYPPRDILGIVLSVAPQFSGILVAAFEATLARVVLSRSVVVSTSAIAMVSARAYRLHVATGLSRIPVAAPVAATIAAAAVASVASGPVFIWATTTVTAIPTARTGKVSPVTAAARTAETTARSVGGVWRSVTVLAATITTPTAAAEVAVTPTAATEAPTEPASATAKVATAPETSIASVTATESTAESTAEATAETLAEPTWSHRSLRHRLGVASATETTAKSAWLPSLYCPSSLDVYLDATILDADAITSV
jgi:hypothetical protein